MGGGGSGGSDVQMRNPKSEQKTVGNWYGFQQDQYNNFVANNPLLNAAQGGALDFWKQLPQMLSQFGGFQGELNNYQGQLGDYQKQLGGISGQLGDVYKNAQGQIGGYQDQLKNLFGQVGGLGQSFQKFLGPGSALSAAYNGQGGIGSVLRSHGALTAQGKRNANQEILQSMSGAGTAGSNASIFNQALNREQYQTNRLNNAIGQSQGVLGQQAGAAGALQNIFGQQAGIAGQGAGLTGLLSQIGQGVLGQQAGITGQQAGITGMGAGLTGQKAGLLGQQQALQTGGLNQLLGVGNAGTSQFGGLTNPILGYLGNLFGGNQQASIAQAQINAQQQAAGDSKTSGAIGGGISAIGSIAMAAL